MSLNTELLITLQQIKGLGNKTILQYAQSANVHSLDEMMAHLKTIKKGRLSGITDQNLTEANRIAQRIIERSQEEGIGILSYFESSFPQQLHRCVDEKGVEKPPIVLYYRGNLEALKNKGIAVIGSREPTNTGIKAGTYFTKELARNGFNIISGLAVGCDTYAHQGALLAEGVTTAILSTGLNWDAIYPKENLPLAQEIIDNGGLLLSEYYIGQKSDRFTFVERDRIQAGLAIATIVIQTGIKGGTMHAVHATIHSKKPLYAVKYKLNEDLQHQNVQGNKMLIDTNMATPITSSNLASIIKKLDQGFHTNPINKEISLFEL